MWKIEKLTWISKPQFSLSLKTKAALKGKFEKSACFGRKVCGNGKPSGWGTGVANG